MFARLFILFSCGGEAQKGPPKIQGAGTDRTEPEKETSVPTTQRASQIVRMQASRERPISLGRHSRNCSICGHQSREEIEREFINWTGPKAIAREFGLRDRTAIYRHAHALDLFSKRQRNIRAALEKIIERAG